MRRAGLGVALAAVVMAGCGTDRMMACDEGPYLAAARTPKVQAPEGLSSLNPLDELPLPAASPQEAAADDGPCLESPPQLIRMD